MNPVGSRNCSFPKNNLVIRCQVVREIRRFWEQQGFFEIETPQLVSAPGSESTIEPFRTHAIRSKGYLISSPEHHMKRLIAAGFDRVFQIVHCFRDEELSVTNRPEFSMLEWYRAWRSYEDMMTDVELLVSQVARTVCGTSTISYQGIQLDLAPPWKRLTMAAAFSEFAGIALDECLDEASFLVRAQESGVLSVQSHDDWEVMFFKVLIECVEPALSQIGPVFIVDYPDRMAALARLKSDDARWAERVEAYAGGLELGNGFSELNDADEQEERFLAEQYKRRAAGRPIYPMDREFLDMMYRGMPPAGGFALGIDRLCMLLTDAASIDEVVAFPPEGSSCG